MLLKTLLSTFLLIGVITITEAQITVTNTTFPVVGDTLRTAIALNPPGLPITPPGGPYAWDMSTLTPTSQRVTVYQPAANGAANASFSGAQMVTIDDAGTETYYKGSETSFDNLGYSGTGLGGFLPVTAQARYSPVLPERKAPLNFFDISQASSNAIVALPTSLIMGYLDSLGIPNAGLIDSIRVRISVQRLNVIDAYGTLSIPGGTYDVLRQKRTNYTSTRVDAHTFLGWLDVTDNFCQSGVCFGTDTVPTFHFLSNTTKEPIAILTMNSSQSVVIQAEYKDNSIPNALHDETLDNPQVLISPNPTSDLVTFHLQNMLPGQYILHLFDIHGRMVLAKELISETEQLSLDRLNSGMYFYQVIDASDRIIGVGKVVKE